MPKPKAILLALLTEPLRIPRYLLQKLTVWRLKRRANVTIGHACRLVGVPVIDIHKQAKLTVGEGVWLHSINKHYFLNLFAPVKILADRPGAEVRIGDKCRIYGTCIRASALVSIGSNVLIAGNCQIMDGSGHDLCLPNYKGRSLTTGDAKPVIIENDVWIGAHCIILPGVRIGKGSVIGAGSVVTKSVPPLTVAAGNPAKVVRDYRQGNIVAHQQKSA